MQDEWVVSRIFHKNTDIKKTPLPELLRMNSLGHDLLDYTSLPPLMDPPFSNPDNDKPGCSEGDEFKGPSDGYYPPNNFSIHNQAVMKTEELEDHHRNYDNMIPNYYSQVSFSFTNPNNVLSDYRNGVVEADGNHNPRAFGGVKNEYMVSGLNKQSQYYYSHVEQLSSKSNYSETNSSAVSDQDNMGFRNSSLYDQIQGPSGPLSDLDSLWDDY